MIREIRRRARENHARVALGVKHPTPGVIRSAEAAQGYAEVVLVGPRSKIEETGTTLEIVDGDPEDLLVDLLVDGAVDGVVRGNARAHSTLTRLKNALGAEKLYRAALLRSAQGRVFFLAPVGIDEGASPSDRVRLARLAADYVESLGVTPRVGVLSGGRAEDRGRSQVVDRTLDEAREVTGQLESTGVYAHNYDILVEDAIRRSNVLVAPDGITGNLIFRTLVFLGGGDALGAPVLGEDVVYVDTSRAREDYTDAIVLASSMFR